MYDFLKKKYVKVYDQKFLPEDDFTTSATKKNGLTKKKLQGCPRFTAKHARKIIEVLSEPEYIVCFNEEYDFKQTLYHQFQRIDKSLTLPQYTNILDVQ